MPNRRNFIKLTTLASAMLTLKDFSTMAENISDAEIKMPVMFVGHGNPMNAIEDNEYSRTWKTEGAKLKKPTAILCVSAHWQTRGTFVTSAAKPETIHDFGGFPDELFKTQYAAPGNPELANEITQLSKIYSVKTDDKWGFDHGTWSVLKPMFPAADIPVLQLSLDYTQPPEYHYQLSKILKSLRRKGVLIIGSGNIVHNLGMVQWSDKAYDWAIEFDNIAKKHITEKNFSALVHYEKLGKAAQLSIPTNEHYLPMLYILSLLEDKEQARFFNEKTSMGSMSMRSFVSVG